MENRRLKQTAYSFLIFILLCFQTLLAAQDVMYSKEVQVGVILDMDLGEGKAIYRCITMAISDFYEANPHYRTRIVLEIRDTKGEPLVALSSALDLLENAKVQAIIGPDSTAEARFLEVLKDKTNVPFLSFSTSPFLDHNPYLLRIAQDETTQFRGISAMVDLFQGKNVILIFEKAANGREMASYMVSEFQEKNIHVTYTSLISTSATNEQIREEFHKLQNMQTTVFVIHTPHSLASNVFSVAKEVGMMGEGYIWIVTSKITNFLSTMDTDVIQTMQGVVGFKSYIPESKGVRKFVSKWRKEFYDLNAFVDNGIWAYYDTVYALAMAIESVQTEKRLTGTALLNHISRIKFHGVGGEFKFMKGRTVSKPIQVINVIGKADRRLGFWMANGEFVREIGKTNLSSNNGLENIIFPGGTTNRRRLQMNRKKLRILVPLFGGFPNLVQMAIDPRTNLPTVSGYCGDVFRAAFNALNYGVDVEYIPLEDGRTYNDLIDKVYNKEFDAAIGDITIMTNRTRYVDFTLPISELGIGTLVRNEKKSMWIFLNPLSADLWFTFTAFFLVLGFVIWFTEHRINKEFQGSTNEQIGKTLWFAFSTLVYAHREKLQSNLSRFVVTVWVFVVLVLSSSYTATLSSLLTVQQIASKGGLVQFQGNSPVGESIFNNLKSSDGIIEPLPLPEDYAKALRSGKVGAIIDEIFYIKTVIGMYSADEFSLVAASSTTNGFAFAFQKDSPMTKDLSSEIAKLRADGTLKALEDKWLKRQFSIMSKDLSAPSPTILNLHRFRGLFLISGVSMALAFLMSVVYLVREKCHGRSKIEILRCIFPTSVQVHALDNVFHPAV